MIKIDSFIKFLIFTLVVYLSYLIIQPFIPSVLIALTASIIFYPLFKWLEKKLKIGSGFASFLTVILTVIFIILPLTALAGLIGKEAVDFIRTIDFAALQESITNFQEVTFFGYTFEFDRLKDTVIETIKNIGAYLSAKGPSIAASVWNSLFLFFVFLLLFFYFLKDSEKLFKDLKSVLPYTKDQQKNLFHSFKGIVTTIFYGNLISALIAGAIAYIGFWVFGFKGVLIWALLAMILSFIPTAGTLLLYLIGVVLLFFTSGWLPALLMLGYFIFMELILREEIIKGKVLEDKLKFHPILVFFALVGGVGAFGSLGIIYGPLIVTFLMTLYQFYIAEDRGK